jgi:hypothetical protein
MKTIKFQTTAPQLRDDNRLSARYLNHSAPAIRQKLVWPQCKRENLLTLLLLSCGLARADVEVAAPLAITGYATLGIVHSNNSQSDFTANVINPGNAGYSRDWSAEVDSRLAVQLDLQLARSWRAVVQLVSEQKLNQGYTPAVEWANVQYLANPDLAVRVGRIALPLFLAGDYRKIGYALPWVRPPVELYGGSPVSSSDGIDVSYRWHNGEAHNVTQGFFGHSSIAINKNASARVRSLRGASNTTNYGDLTLRVSAMRAEVTVNLAQELFQGFKKFGALGSDLVERYDTYPKQVSVDAISVNYDPGLWFVMAEASRINARSYLGDKTVAYASLGYRYGNFTPYAVAAISHANMQTQGIGLSLNQLPPASADVASRLNAGLQSLLNSIPQQHSFSAGVRWDWKVNYAFKLQYDRVTPVSGSTGTFINVQPAFKSGVPIGVVSAAVNVVF